ncbi:MAG: hypothetical protein WAN89_07665 [Lawsonella sp.]
MRPNKLLSAVAAMALTLGLGAGTAVADPQPIRVDEAGVVTGGYIQNNYGNFGPHETTQTVAAVDCGLVFTIYEKVLEIGHNNKDPHKCWGTFPDATESPVGVEYVYPKNIDKMGKLPVIIYTPGIGAEPGMTNDNYKLWASNGYIVAVTYSFLNWTGYTDVNAAIDLQKQSEDPKSPLYGHIDRSKVILTGHSAGGGSTQSAAGWLLPKMQEEFPGLKVLGAVPLQPGPSLFFQPSLITVPTFIVSGEQDTICQDPFWVRDLYRTIDKAPAWIGMLKGAYHGQAMDHPRHSANAASVMAFAEWLVKGDQKAKEIFVGSNYFLQSDAAFMKVERNEKAAALK